MKKTFIIMLVVALAAALLAGPAEAKKKKKPTKVTREAQGTYTSTGIVAAGNCTQTDAINCPRIPGGPGEIYITANVSDATGQPVAVAVKADLDNNGNTETLYGTFCGETSEPMLIDEGAQVTFWIGISPDTAALGCAPGTQGTVDVVFSNMP